MPDVGDRVRIASTKVGDVPRDGVVTRVIWAAPSRQVVDGRRVDDCLLHVRWSTGEESTIVPASGSVAVIGKVKASPAKKSSAPVKAIKAKKSSAPAKAAKKSPR